MVEIVNVVGGKSLFQRGYKLICKKTSGNFDFQDVVFVSFRLELIGGYFEFLSYIYSVIFIYFNWFI